MHSKRLVVIAYDISNNKRRKKVAELMEQHGTRVNYSVFECFLTKNELEKIKIQAGELIKKKLDSILYYELCASCIEKIDRQGNLSKIFVATHIV